MAAGRAATLICCATCSTARLTSGARSASASQRFPSIPIIRSRRGRKSSTQATRTASVIPKLSMEASRHGQFRDPAIIPDAHRARRGSASQCVDHDYLVRTAPRFDQIESCAVRRLGVDVQVPEPSDTRMPAPSSPRSRSSQAMIRMRPHVRSSSTLKKCVAHEIHG